MSCWLTIPSKRPPEEAEKCLKLWWERGYKIALFCDEPFQGWGSVCDELLTGEYPGYAVTVNRLVRVVSREYSDAEWFIAAGDDVEPDLNHSAEEIAVQCRAYFHGVNRARGVPFNEGCEVIDTFGVMQPTGDRWGENPKAQNPAHRSAYIDRVAGSAWIGREFAKRVNQGRGPLWPEYFHMGVDEELQAVAQMLGVFWQRPDLIQLHKHWGRAKEGEVMGHRRNMPKFLERANSAEEWDKYKALFAKRQAAGFPGSEPI
jgi:hypothetical protein